MSSNQFSILGSSRAPADPSISSNATASTNQTPKKKHRAGRKHKKARRKSFAAPPENIPDQDIPPSSHSGNRPGFYMRGRNLSNTSIESEALLDHREHQYPRPRRPSTLTASLHMPQSSRSRIMQGSQSHDHEEVEEDNNETAPLLSSSPRQDLTSSRGYGSGDGRRKNDASISRAGSSRSGKKSQMAPITPSDKYNINYPPSIPGSPTLGPSDPLDMSYGDSLMRDDLAEDATRPDNILESNNDPLRDQSPFERRHTIALQAQADVCFPQEGMSELAEEDARQARDSRSIRARRRRRNKWPDLAILEEWSRIEKEDRSEERRMKKITEPQLVNGRLRPIHKGWYQTEEDAPYRFTYFNEEFQSTIHSQTISELVQPDAGFKELFLPDPPILSDSSDDDDDDEPLTQVPNLTRNGGATTRGPSRQPSFTPNFPTSDLNPGAASRQQVSTSASSSGNHSGNPSPLRSKSPFSGIKSPPPNGKKQPRYGERPVWWLDVLSPTESEMKVLAKAFGIHPLTSEDIMLQEQREKVELFRHYYFVNYRSFDQDAESENHLEPINMYVVVFREGVLSFHFSQTPHPAHVRRRVRQLKDFMILSADWISYAIIDDITDVYFPLIQTIEEEVDDIDDRILQFHSHSDPSLSPDEKKQRDGEKGTEANADNGGDMLRRVGDCRKRVMTLYRLLGNKADVIKSFAKRCNEHWEVAPRSEIGLYLGDIQDHIVTMTANLSHYEVILARCHANYIAQINIRMNERQEQTADVLGKLTVLGTIVMPMNIITGLWGMNVWVPGQEYEGDLKWFFAITAALLLFGLACFIIAKRVYNIV
ncbi:cora-domain-containing protein [Daldinia loculata]|uniref:cora-domain-containing protein n=1 Tax=Daldinia loculata TaxID=103429 RepID=UPI0020C5970A|nr:cora-domain-containing protein [Daldinia loculata]KAI1642429.1 cora-domain-containing protein [Daldinia loculata]KAI2782346.1 cora-domain-containing protein [Daldinia loculata]